MVAIRWNWGGIRTSTLHLTKVSRGQRMASRSRRAKNARAIPRNNNRFAALPNLTAHRPPIAGPGDVASLTFFDEVWDNDSVVHGSSAAHNSTDLAATDSTDPKTNDLKSPTLHHPMRHVADTLEHPVGKNTKRPVVYTGDGDRTKRRKVAAVAHALRACPMSSITSFFGAAPSPVTMPPRFDGRRAYNA